MTHQELRKKFLSFFESKEHKILPSSSLVPDNDPTVLFTTAGMQQFKSYFLGEKDSDREFGTRRVTTIQKCFRTTDIDEIGDETHLTFFEMLGNFSFGDYFKKEAIDYAYEFLTNIINLEKEKLAVTIFKGDEEVVEDSEAREFWKKYLSEDRIFKFGREANFWGPPGKTGPCGPSSEIHYEVKDEACERDGCGPNCPCGRFVEIWNLVFMQYFKNEAGIFNYLPQPSIDTGAGLERLAVILQRKDNVFSTDLLQPLIFELVSRKQILRDSDWKGLRIISDHLRGSVFLISDGVRPSNIAQGYVLRRIMRRAIRYAHKLEFEENFFVALISKAIEIFVPFYPELERGKNDILNVWEAEAEKFNKTLGRGLREFEKLIEEIKNKNEKEVSGEAVFHLYDTYGFPLEFSEELAREAGIQIDRKGFEEEFERHKLVSKAGAQGKFGGHGLILSGELKAGNEAEVKIVTRLHTATHLMHEALRRVLGKHVRQLGSDITPERLRFDFSHPQKVTKEELDKVEALVNLQIQRNLSRDIKEMKFDDALKIGALAFFKEKYPEIVNVYSFVDPESDEVFSREVCGGPHTARTGEIGRFKIIKEEAIGAGVRRIKAKVS